jgi:hypothetical protein
MHGSLAEQFGHLLGHNAGKLFVRAAPRQGEIIHEGWAEYIDADG